MRFSTKWAAAAAAGLLVGLVTAGVLAWTLTPGRRPPPPAVPDRWEVSDLVRRLDERGVSLHAVSTMKDGPIGGNAFLTEDDRPWPELNALHLTRERIGEWGGVVYCEKLTQPQRRELQLADWGDFCLQKGPFVFFGDPRLLVRIDAALSGAAD
jgi:hypothetical protein